MYSINTNHAHDASKPQPCYLQCNTKILITLWEPKKQWMVHQICTVSYQYLYYLIEDYL
jgi:hypothetical protein